MRVPCIAVVLLAGCFKPITIPPATYSPSLQGVAYGGGKYVAVGKSGAIVTSSDGKTWTSATAPSTSTDLTGVAYGGSRFVAVGTGGYVLTSTDGVTWTDYAVPALVDYQAVVYGDGVWVVVGWSYTILTSTDGEHWSLAFSGSGVWQSVAFTRTEFVAVSRVGTVAVSADGVSWSIATQGNTATSSGLCAVSGGPGGETVALDINANIETAQGADTTGLTAGATLWTVTTTILASCTLVYDGDVLVAASPAAGDLAVSADGVTWTPVPGAPPLAGLAFNGSMLVGVGDAGSVYQATCSSGACTGGSQATISVPVPTATGSTGGTSTGGGGGGGGSCAGKCDADGACGACSTTASCCTGAVCISGRYCSKNSVASGCECNAVATAGVCADFADNGLSQITSCGGVGTSSCNTQTSWCCPGLVGVQNGSTCTCEDPNGAYDCPGQ